MIKLEKSEEPGVLARNSAQLTHGSCRKDRGRRNTN